MTKQASPSAPVPCTTCGTAFTPRLRYQIDASAGATSYFCSLPCRAAPNGDVSCAACGTSFVPVFAYQTRRAPDGSQIQACSEACVTRLEAATAKRTATPKTRTWRLAVLNQKGGTGKTTTSVNLASGLATEGRRVLLVDADPQGNVGTCLGVRSPKTLADVLTKKYRLEDVIIPVGETLDVICSDERLAQAEIALARHPHRAGVLAAALAAAPAYDHIIIDCGPSLSLINQNALCAVQEVLVPVACDYLSLVGVKQVLRTIDNVRKHLGHPLGVAGVLPTMYDARARVCQDALETLQKHFGEGCLKPIRQNTRLKEAPAHKKTIFEHDPNSNGAADYGVLVQWALKRGAPPDAPAQKAAGAGRPAVTTTSGPAKAKTAQQSSVQTTSMRR